MGENEFDSIKFVMAIEIAQIKKNNSVESKLKIILAQPLNNTICLRVNIVTIFAFTHNHAIPFTNLIQHSFKSSKWCDYFFFQQHLSKRKK